tara:strand:+ start:86 stop:394 length:309 start_codon:yes stop_codon:yes gene_type:complete
VSSSNTCTQNGITSDLNYESGRKGEITGSDTKIASNVEKTVVSIGQVVADGSIKNTFLPVKTYNPSCNQGGFFYERCEKDNATKYFFTKLYNFQLTIAISAN